MAFKKDNPGCPCCETCPATDCEGGGTMQVNKATFEVDLPDTFVFWHLASFPARYFKVQVSGFSAFNGTYELEKNPETCEFNAPQYGIEGEAGDATVQRFSVEFFCPGTLQQTYTTLTVDLTMNLAFLWSPSSNCWVPGIGLVAIVTVSEPTGWDPNVGLQSTGVCMWCAEEDVYSDYTGNGGPPSTNPCFTAIANDIWATVTPSAT